MTPVEVASAVPPAEVAYHRNVPELPVDALSVTVPGLHEIPLVAVTVLGVPLTAFTCVLVVVHTGEDVVNVTK